MTTTPEFDDLTLLARMVRRRHHDREQDLAELRDRADESGDSTDYDVARIDALADCQDDLLALLERVESLKATAVPSTERQATRAVRRTAVAGPVLDPSVGSCPPGGQPHDEGNPRDEGNPHATGVPRDEEDPYVARALTDVHSLASAADMIDSTLPDLASGTWRPGARPTVDVRVRRDSTDFRAMFDPRRGQLAFVSGAVESGAGEYQDYVTLLPLLCLPEAEAITEHHPFVCLAVRDDVVSDVVHVVSGWVAAIDHSDEGLILEFDDGASVAYESVIGIRVG